LGGDVRALLVSGIYPPDIGGPATYIPKLERYLVENAWSVRVVSLLNGKKFLTFSSNRFFVGRNLPLPIRIFLTTLMINVESKNADCVFANGLHQEVAMATCFSNKYKVAKIVGDPIWERYQNKSKLAIGINEFNESIEASMSIRLQRKFLVWALNRFDVVVCPSRELCNFVKKWGVRSSVIYLPNGVEIEKSRPQGNREYDIVLVGRLVKWKNIDLLLNACRNLKLRVIIVGDGPERVNLERIAAESNSKVTFLGQVDSNEISKILSNCKVYVTLSSYEGMSFSLLQAMSLGMLAVVSDIEANTELVRNLVDGIVVNIHDGTDLENTLRDAVINREQYEYMARAAATKIQEEFSIELNLRSLETLLVKF